MIELIAIAKDEDLYLDEWIDHHYALGFDRIIVYDNNSKNPIQARPDRNMTVRPWTMREYQQVPCYNHHIENTEAEWTMVLDIDEFLILHNRNNIQELVNDYRLNDLIYIRWTCYGANGQYFYEPQPVKERFTKQSVYPIHDTVKPIFRADKAVGMVDPHHLKMKPKAQPALYISLEDATINHYVTKSFEEYVLRVHKGRVDIKGYKPMSDFFKFNPEMHI